MLNVNWEQNIGLSLFQIVLHIGQMMNHSEVSFCSVRFLASYCSSVLYFIIVHVTCASYIFDKQRNNKDAIWCNGGYCRSMDAHWLGRYKWTSILLNVGNCHIVGFSLAVSFKELRQLPSFISISVIHLTDQRCLLWFQYPSPRVPWLCDFSLMAWCINMVI